METNPNENWTMEKLTLLTPEWQADGVRASERLSIALRERKRPHISSWAIPAVAAAVCAAILAIPQTRAKAQELWAQFVMNRVDVVRLDLSGLPLESHLNIGTMSQPARDLGEAERLAGFHPNLPAGILSATPQLSVTGTMVAEQTIRVSKLEAALKKFNATDAKVPPEWDGVTLRTIIGPVVTADYPLDGRPGEIRILQSPPFSLTMPAGFPLERFAETAFRSIGVSRRDAGTMAEKFAANPAWLMDIPPDEPVNVQELSLTSGPALLVEDFDNRGAVAKDTVIRSTANRIYSVESPDRDLSVKIANSLP